MAARWGAKIGDLNTGSGDFLARNSPHEMVLSRGDVDDMDIDRSILAIFEDSTPASEGKNSVEEENESLLSALSEMLDDVEDDDGTLSPFDTLPDKTLGGHPRPRDTSAELSLAHRLRPRPKPPNLMFTGKNEEEKGLDCKLEKKAPPKRLKKESQALLETKSRRSEGEIEVFSSTSLASLVRIMHSYCLKLHVGEGDEPGGTPTVFSQEEVWKYERPSEESDEEINVVSDDEAPAKDEGADGKLGKVLKSVLLNGSSPRAAACRGKKRVSFGPVEVASFDEPEEDGWSDGSAASRQESETNSADAPEAVAGAPPSSETRGSEAEVVPPKSETKGKSLSLQEYRQLRQQRLPLVEKRGNYTTKWPSVSVPPTELTPILGLQAQTRCSATSKTTHPNLQRHTATPNAATPQARRTLKLRKPESKEVSPASSAPDAPLSHESRRSPAKRSTLLSTDPPNPVLLPLPLRQTASPSAAATASSQPKPPVSSPNRNCYQTCIAASFTPTPPGKQKSLQSPPEDLVLPPSPESPSEFPFAPPPCSRQASPSESGEEGTDDLPDVSQSDRPADETSRSGSSCNKEPAAAADSGIEAPDLTSLLEQFEETQAKEKSVFDGEPNASVSNLPADVDQNPAQPERTPASPPPRHSGAFQSGVVDVPEPLSTEVILSTQQPPRRRSPPSKAIQIIDPRPLPAKKTHTNAFESPAAPHTFSYLLSEHDYCGSVDDPASQRSNAKSSSVSSRSHAELQATVRNPRLVSETTSPILTGQTKSQLHLDSEARANEAPRRPRCVPTPEQTSHPASCPLPTPPPSPPIRGRQKRRYRRRSPRSDSSSSSRSSSSSSSSSSGSRSPKRQRMHHKHSESSSSCSSSPSYSHSPPRRYSFSYARSSRSRSRSWSRSPSASRSPSPYLCRSRWRDVCSSRESRKLRREHEIRMQKLKAIDERRVVYVGRIRRTMTHDELRERFAEIGEVECVSLHFRERGDHYGFVTFYNMEDAFAAIDSGGKLRRPDELPFDICFGGRRQFCNSNYSDLDANRDAEPSKARLEDVDFDSLLKQAQRGLKR